MARTLDLIRGYMFFHRMEPRGAGTSSDPVLTKFFTSHRNEFLPACPHRIWRISC